MNDEEFMRSIGWAKDSKKKVESSDTAAAGPAPFDYTTAPPPFADHHSQPSSADHNFVPRGSRHTPGRHQQRSSQAQGSQPSFSPHPKQKSMAKTTSRLMFGANFCCCVVAQLLNRYWE